ncbi:hypothetical protein ONS95_010515 [Cadophora gregata]|uniref:uncharacterized protein n=1 Tax=Cadophora gregata TaxID=51156 RepID=UPI0026DD053C|nr:uncharacterized protein ONS95_010515 [Cadophora gregata]KAK0122265.1 hypothetical protein ONS95_010515 [Cadophora gregata]
MAFSYEELSAIEQPELPDDVEIAKRPNTRYDILHWLLHGILLSAILTLLIWGGIKAEPDSSAGAGFQRIYSPLWNTVVYSPKIYDHADFESKGSSSPFKGYPMPELDQAWAGILNHSLVLIDEDAMNALGQPTHNAKRYGDKYFAYIDVFHQLHCLDLVRKYIFRGYYPSYIAFQDTEERILFHVDHCMDIIRQKIMCDSDIDVIVYTDHGDEGKQPKARFDITHMCRDFEAIQQWTFDNAWDF